MAADSILPIALGSSVPSASAGALAGLLGMRIEVTSAAGTKAYRVVKAGGALSTIGNAVLVSALDANNAPTWVVNTTTTAASPYGGVAVTSQVALSTGDYFLLQVAGPAQVISQAAIAAGAYIGSSTVAKQVVTSTNGTAIGAAVVAAGAGGATIAANLFAS